VKPFSAGPLRCSPKVYSQIIGLKPHNPKWALMLKKVLNPKPVKNVPGYPKWFKGKVPNKGE